MANAVSGEYEIVVCLVETIGKSIVFEIVEHFRSWREEERANEMTLSRAHRAKPVETGAANEAEEKSFRLIVLVVSEGD